MEIDHTVTGWRRLEGSIIYDVVLTSPVWDFTSVVRSLAICCFHPFRKGSSSPCRESGTYPRINASGKLTGFLLETAEGLRGTQVRGGVEGDSALSTGYL